MQIRINSDTYLGATAGITVAATVDRGIDCVGYRVRGSDLIAEGIDASINPEWLYFLNTDDVTLIKGTNVFKEYTSKPTIRNAAVLTSANFVDRGKEATGARYAIIVCDVTNAKLNFVAHQTPVVGDYVVYLDVTDVYHCSKEVFTDRNIVGDK